MKPEDRKRLKQHIEMIVEHKEPTHSQTEKILRDACEEQIKGKLELEDKNRKLRLELNALRFKEAQEQRFIWWVREVFAKNVQELLLELEKTTFPVTPFGMSALVKRIKEGTNGIYDGTYLDVEISAVVKNDNLKPNVDLAQASTVAYDSEVARMKLEAQLARRDEIITRLKEDGDRLASTYVIEVFPHEWVCRGGCHHWARFGEQIEHSPDCPITLHRALMKELE